MFLNNLLFPFGLVYPSNICIEIIKNYELAYEKHIGTKNNASDFLKKINYNDNNLVIKRKMEKLSKILVKKWTIYEIRPLYLNKILIEATKDKIKNTLVFIISSVFLFFNIFIYSLLKIFLFFI